MMFEKNIEDPLKNNQKKNLQKLHRYVQQTAHRLDLQLKNATDWREYFDSDAILTRQKLKEACEELLFNGSSEVSRRAEDILWRKCFYDVIQKLRQVKKLLQTDATARTLYDAHLNAAHSFYHNLLISLRKCSAIGQSLCWLYPAMNFDQTTSKSETRYHLDIEDTDTFKLAEKFYNEAILVFPDNGMPHNQLGTLKKQAGYSDCEVAYHYLRCLNSVITFDGVEENLKRIFDRARWISKENKQSEDSDSDALESFLTEFLELIRLFMTERLQPDDYSKPCQSVIEKFAEVLRLTEENIQRSISTKQEQTSDFNWRINDSLMIKVFAMCIMMVTTLRQKESAVLSAGIAFTFTLLSKLLDFIARTLPLSSLRSSVSKLGNPDVAKRRQGRQQDERSYQSRKAKIKQLKRQRRRRREISNCSGDSSEESSTSRSEDTCGSTSASDLSEGELEFSEDSDLCSSATTDSDNGDRFKAASRFANGPPARQSILYISTLYDKSQSFVSQHCYLPTLKVMSDWLRYSDDIIKSYAKNIPCIWQKYAKVFGELPSDQALITILQHSKNKKDAEFISELKGQTTRQTKALPEDKLLIGLPLFSQLHDSLDFNWQEHSRTSHLLQFIVRLKSLNVFGRFLSQKLSDFPIDDSETPSSLDDDRPCPSKGEAISLTPESAQPIQPNTQDNSITNSQESAANQEQLMKALATQRLMHDVSKLQNQMISSEKDVKALDIPSYLILDSQALCRHISLIRSLVRSREFITIIPIQVIQALDELKKYNPSAREATKFLEAEIRQKSRWLRLQKHQESLDSTDTSRVGKGKRNISLDDWRFIQVAKCARYFASKHSGCDAVSVLTSKLSNDSSNTSLGTRISSVAIALCDEVGIRIEPVVNFYER
eukprot:gene20316-22315_t